MLQDIITGAIALAANPDMELDGACKTMSLCQMLISSSAEIAAAVSLLALPLRNDQERSEGFAAWKEATIYVAELKAQNKYDKQDASYASPQWRAAVTAQGYDLAAAPKGLVFSHYIGWNVIRCYLLSDCFRAIASSYR